MCVCIYILMNICVSIIRKADTFIHSFILVSTGPMFLYFASQAVHDPFADCTGNSAYEEGVPATYMDKKLYDQVDELL